MPINISFLDNWASEAQEFRYKALEHGKFELRIPPNPDGSCRIPHNSIIKVNTSRLDLAYPVCLFMPVVAP